MLGHAVCATTSSFNLNFAHYPYSSVASVFSDRVSMAGNAVVSFCFLANLWTEWPLTLTFCVCIGHEISHGMKGKGQRLRLECRFETRSVWRRSWIGDSCPVGCCDIEMVEVCVCRSWTRCWWMSWWCGHVSFSCSLSYRGSHTSLFLSSTRSPFSTGTCLPASLYLYLSLSVCLSISVPVYIARCLLEVLNGPGQKCSILWPTNTYTR